MNLSDARSLAITLAALVTAAPAVAQSFQSSPGQIPGGSPFNDSFTENVDFADVDLDGDLDAALADGGDCCNDQNRLWINQGGLQAGTPGVFADETAARLPAVLDTSRDMDFADVDADGDYDLFTSNSSQLSNQPTRFLINSGGLQGGSAGFFVDETALRFKNLGIHGSSIATSHVLAGGGYIDWTCDGVFGDLDSDGDLDLFQSTYGGATSGKVPSRIFLNDGNGAFEEFNPTAFQLTGSTIADGDPGLWCEGVHMDGTTNASGVECDISSSPLGVELGDLDADFDLEVLVGALNEVARLFDNRVNENQGALGFRDVTTASLASTAQGDGNYEQEFGDLDLDGDLDIYGLNWAHSYWDTLMLNDGEGQMGPFITQPVQGLVDHEADWLDYDNDGDLDLFVTATNAQDRLYRNTGAPGWSLVNVTSTQLPASFDHGLGADPADVDLDGDYDLLIANETSQPNVLLLNVSQNADVHAPYLPELEQVPDRNPSSTPSQVRVHVYDNAPWTVLQFLAVTLEVRVDAGPPTSYPMTFQGGNLFRGEIPGALVGQVSYRARAVDAYGNAGLSGSWAYSSGGCAAGIQVYCTSKPTSIAGCLPSLGFSGTPSSTAGSGFVVTGGPTPGKAPGVFLYATNGPASTPATGPFGSLCMDLSKGLYRVGLQNGGGQFGVCNGIYTFDFNQYAATQTEHPDLVAGAQVEIQLWYRDPPNPGLANLTEAASFVLCP